MKSNNRFLQSASFLALVFALTPLSAFATAPTAGLDTPTGVNTLPIAVEGQTGLTLNADTSGANPPKPSVNFTGPLVEGNTTISTDGSMVIANTTGAVPTTGSEISITAPASTSAPYLLTGNAFHAAYGYVGNNSMFGGANYGGNIWMGGYVPAIGQMVDMAFDGGTDSEFTLMNAGANAAGGTSFAWTGTSAMPARTNMFLENSGNVGFNTITPTANVQIDSQLNKPVSLFLNANGSGNIPQYLLFGENTVPEWSVAGGGITSPKDNNLYVMNMQDNSAGIDDAGYVMTFAQGTGNVGIGTTTPTAKLTLTNNTADTWFSIENQTPAGNVWGIISSGTGSLAVPGSFNIGQIAGGYTHFTDALAIVPTGGSTYNVGINNSVPAYALDVNGTVNASGGAGALSDRRHKKDIQPLANNGLETVEKLQPVNFQWKEPKDDGMKGEQIGFIAQDVQKILPDTILTANDKDKTLSIKYNELIPVLTKAIQEQQAEIEALKQEVATLKDK